MVTRKDLLEYYTRCLTLNSLEDNKFAYYKKYKYSVRNDELWLEDIDISINTKKLTIEPLFDVFNVHWLDKYDKVKYLDLGSISVLNQTFDGSSLEVFYANKVRKLPSECFFDCINLKEVSINSCISIGDYAFSGCESLEKLIVEHVRYVGENAFENSGIKELSLGHTDLNDYSFSKFYALEKLNMKSCNYCGIGLFIDTRNLKYINFGKFNDSKKHFWLLKENSKSYVLRETSEENKSLDLSCYESLYGSLKDGYVVVRNKELNYRSILSNCEIYLELSDDLLDKNLSDYYLYYFSNIYLNHSNFKFHIKVGDNEYKF